MAKRNIQGEIDVLEARRDNLEASLLAHENYKKLKGQGMAGAETEFADPRKFEENLQKVRNRLSILYGLL